MNKTPESGFKARLLGCLQHYRKFIGIIYLLSLLVLFLVSDENGMVVAIIVLAAAVCLIDLVITSIIKRGGKKYD